MHRARSRRPSAGALGALALCLILAAPGASSDGPATESKVAAEGRWSFRLGEMFIGLMGDELDWPSPASAWAPEQSDPARWPSSRNGGVFARYWFAPSFASEIFYTGLAVPGSIDPGSIDPGSIDPGSTENDMLGVGPDPAHGALGISTLGAWSLDDRFDLFGRLGAFQWNGGPADGPLGRPPSGDVDLMFGLGGRFDANEFFGFRAQWERFGEFGEERLDIFSGSLILRF